jgi:hypothetical protein
MRHIYTAEYYLAIKKNELMLFAGMWMEMEALMLNEISQAEKIKYSMFFFLCRS